MMTADMTHAVLVLSYSCILAHTQGACLMLRVVQKTYICRPVYHVLVYTVYGIPYNIFVYTSMYNPTHAAFLLTQGT